VEFLALVREGEGETLEFKESFAEEKEILETICAFSNSRGGRILIGVDDRGKIKGVTLGKNTLQNFLNKVKSSIEPMLIPQLEQVKVGGKTVVIVQVAEGINKPYFFKGVAFKRVGKSNQRLPKDELEAMILEKHREVASFEDRPIDTTLETIDEKLVKDFLAEASVARKVELRSESKEEFLKRVGAVRDGRPTFCAVLFFSRNPQLHIPYAVVKCGTFAGGVLRREREIGGDVRGQIKGALEFLRESLNVYFRIDENGKRVETYEIPLEALREAVVNALAHRDYSIASPVYVKVFEDRVEVVNPGKLPPPLKPEDLKKDHPSVLRNPKLANFLFLSGFIEKWGTGTNKMVELCVKQGLREPEFLEEDGFFKVILYRGVLNELQRRILELVKEREITSGELARETGVNERTARKYLSTLCSLGLVARKKIGRRVLYYLP
jgi:ATP-dependent DNA helicase RecG